MKTFFLGLALSAALFGQNQSIDDDHVPNGRFWRTMTHREKIIYLTGLGQGIELASIIAAVHTPEVIAWVKDAVPSAFNTGDYERELDALYNDTENVLINLQMGWLHCNTKLKGTWTKEALEKDLISLRQSAATHYTGKQP
jgi:hypothetical protein